MGVSRTFANIVTLGAVEKVDAAERSYKRTLAQYNKYKNLCQDIEKLKEDIKQLQKELNKKKAVIRKIYKNAETRARLSNVEIKAIEEYKSCAKEIESLPCFYMSTLFYADWEDSATENLSMTLSTAIMNTVIPFSGAIGAHSAANDKVAEIQEKENEIIEAIEKITPQALKMVKAQEQCKLVIKTLSTVKSVVDEYGNF